MAEKIDLHSRESTISEGLKWLLELEMLQDPNVHNAIILNIFKVSRHIKDVQLVIDSDRKRMLVYIEVSRIGRWFYLKNIFMEVESMLKDTLPSYVFRITNDSKVLQRAIELTSK